METLPLLDIDTLSPNSPVISLTSSSRTAASLMDPEGTWMVSVTACAMLARRVLPMFWMTLSLRKTPSRLSQPNWVIKRSGDSSARK